MHENTMGQSEYKIDLKGGVFALGNFDGVHRGHQAVIKTTIEKAQHLGVPARVLTLEPHPRSVLKPEIGPFRLTPAPIKLQLLERYGVKDVVVIEFSHEFMHVSATDFVERYLLERYAVHHVVAGFDFVFGHQRQGTMKDLRSLLTRHQVGVTEVTPFRDKSGEIMSSSRIRECLKLGDLATVHHILGRPWSITGRVEEGAQRGRELSVPTANIRLGEYLRPRYGVYAIRASATSDAANILEGVANIGVRPTVDGKTELLEFHLFNFNRSLYGESWQVELIDFIRPEQNFGSLEALREQIVLDIEVAKSILLKDPHYF